MGWSQHLFSSLWRVLTKEVKQHVGTDQFGNKYYYIPEYKNWRGQTVQERRIVEVVQKKEVDYEIGDIPAEWEAWIRRMRKIPPTMEKIKYLESEIEEFKVLVVEWCLVIIRTSVWLWKWLFILGRETSVDEGKELSS
ncbi:NADH dehydrogenase [ubiquinone] 1 alpha subcomplex assembly factor 2 [Trichechus manatus latirostris]|uniref:NADH dehydrogenase [ubiquinone] 1 alpha subcomplex assembly factor 2 n=1 Tax=Trichechus manatus latirostris TaxID=127582 RepID=A0A2Y9QV54_TRIMA|nr:NADH dehydrogenase [ubiquinone] 1 alpha subcomplex assembly factor 2 [Trichechus manatus latirostris]